MGVGGVTVVKLGGSFAGDLSLPHWLDALLGCAGRVVVVPGGGPFADAVRAAQLTLGFDDHAAHRMALLAMEQFGCVIAASDPRFKMASSPVSIIRAIEMADIPVWAPARMVLCASDIAASWDVTSDSLAAWLAGKLHAERLLVVKQVELGAEPVSAAELVSLGVVDPLFPEFLKASGVSASILGTSAAATLTSAVIDFKPSGAPIVLP